MGLTTEHTVRTRATSQEEQQGSEKNDDHHAVQDSSRIAKRRSKTGCLTCRKRRIKCGEQKPSCNNCVKSKRQCDYNTRIIFRKFPFYAGFSRPGIHAQPFDSVPPTEYSGPRFDNFPPSYYGNMGSLPQLTPIRPRPAPAPATATEPPYSTADKGPPSSAALFHPPVYYPSPQGIKENTSTNQSSAAVLSLENSSIREYRSDQSQGTRTQPESTSRTPQDSLYPSEHDGESLQRNQIPNPNVVSSHQSFINPTQPADMPPTVAVPALSISDDWRIPAGSNDARDLLHESRSLGNGSESSANLYGPSNPGLSPLTNQSPSDVSPTQGYVGMNPSDCTQFLETAAVEMVDDDYYDISSDEEEAERMNSTLISSIGPGRQKGSDKAITPYQQNLDILRYTSSSGFLFPGILDIYRSERVASPLKNVLTARLFAHFIVSTAPNLSPFERYSGRSRTDNSRDQTASSVKDIWTNTMPQMAFHEQGLLHAMLAISSLEIAKQQGASLTPSVKHYSWSLRRVHRSLARNKSRRGINTLAATLLLGFWEVMIADTPKWSTHICGAKQLIMENHFYKALKVLLLQKRDRYLKSTSGHFEPTIIDRLNGRSGNSPYFGLMKASGEEEADPDQIFLFGSPEFKAFQDLFWWYIKMDIIHALLGCDHLLLPYDRWLVPPRAIIGDIDAVYGSSDHCSILMGRVATFAAKDRSRKIKAMAQDAQRQSLSGRGPPMPPSAPFYGMAPSGGKSQMPQAFQSASEESRSPSTQSDDADLGTQTAAAQAEWDQIRDACALFQNHLGPMFQPLSEDQQQSFDTPFGRACLFRTFDIAAVWMNFYFSLIVLHRIHPKMPPAAHVAVGVAAPQTARFANEIGRIAAGISPVLPNSQSDPTFLGAYNECTGPLFWAGVQYQDHAQRIWTVKRLCEIERKTGSGTGGLCANGCESTWVKAAEMGRGPPYERISRDFRSADQRVSGRYMHEAGGAPVDPADRRLLPYRKDTQLFWATGILGTADDLSQMSLNE